MTTVMRVRPSGDTTGATDTAAINAALAVLNQSSHVGVPGTLVLGGKYYLNDTITCGVSSGWPTSIYGVPHADITWAGSQGSHYMIKFTGYSGFGRRSLLNSVTLNGRWWCRGVLFEHIPHKLLCDGAFLSAFREVAIDAPSCWCSEIRNTTITAMAGIGIRARDFNKGVIRCCQLQGYGSYHSAGIYTTDSVNLWKYEIDNGKAAAEAYYGDDYRQYWPAIDDDTVLTKGGKVVQTLESQRAGMVLHGIGMLVESTTCEPSKYCDYPVIYLENEGPTAANAETGLNTLQQIYLESCSNRFAKIVVQGNEVGGASYVGGLTRISDVFATDTTQATASCRALIELRGGTHYVRVKNICATKLATAIVYAADGTHVDPSVHGALTWSDTIARDNWITAAEGATVTHTDQVSGAGYEASSDGAVHLGDPATDGTWRIIRSGDDLVMQRLESGEWTTKSTVTAVVP